MADKPPDERTAFLPRQPTLAEQPGTPAHEPTLRAAPSPDEPVTRLDANATLAQRKTDQLVCPTQFSVCVPGYEILDELGRGGMGVVYKARHLGLDRLVALKMILSAEFADASDVERFRMEAVQLARAQHPNIVQIFEVGEYDGRPFFAMEFLGGGSLAGTIAQKPLAAREAAQLWRRWHPRCTRPTRRASSTAT
ncbi:MAG: protein kinase [Gemmataceae bacterium]